jgi:hydroxyethylthiazole kinase
VDAAADAAVILAKELNTTLAITGAADLITDGKIIYRVSNGHKLMGYVTGTGCTATVIIGAFLAIDSNPAEATTTALAYFGLAGEKAAAQGDAPGSFQIALLDALYSIDKKQMEEGAKIQIQ